MKALVRKWLWWMLMVLIVISPVVAQAQVVAVLPEMTSDSHALLTVELPEDVEVVKVSIDASSVGGASMMPVSLELLTVSLKSTVDVAPGKYALPVTIETANGEVLEEELLVEVIETPESERPWDEEIIYFMLTDRFADGDESNNNPFDLPYEEAENDRGAYQGGDFVGIRENLAYLADLGITTLWISPIVMNVRHNVEENSANPEYYAYHGYWALDFTELNPHFGSLEDFHALIDAAAEYEIEIMVDVVLNHVGYGLMPADEGIASLNSVPEGFPTDAERDVFAEMLRTEPGSDDLTMSLSGLPDLVTEDPAVREQIVNWQTSWLDWARTDKGNSIASYRVDTVNHVDHTTLQHFKNELVAIDPTFNLLGESWGATFNNAKGFLNAGMMDSVLDFGFKDVATRFINGQLESANEVLMRRNHALTSSALTSQFLSSHDEIGFLYKLTGNEGKAMVAATLQLTAKGQPVIYYGEELGQSGPNNWPIYGNRYDFAWDDIEDNPMHEHYQKIIHFRRLNSELMARGSRSMVAGFNEEDWLAVAREYEGESVYVLFNLNEEAIEVSLPIEAEDVVYYDYYSDVLVEPNENGDLLVTIPAIDAGGTALIGVAGAEIE